MVSHYFEFKTSSQEGEIESFYFKPKNVNTKQKNHYITALSVTVCVISYKRYQPWEFLIKSPLPPENPFDSKRDFNIPSLP